MIPEAIGVVLMLLAFFLMGVVTAPLLTPHATKAYHGLKALLLAPRVVRALLAWFRRRWAIAMTSGRNLNVTLSSVYNTLYRQYEESDRKHHRLARDMDSIASLMAETHSEPLGITKEHMADMGHLDRYYWNGRWDDWEPPQEEDTDD